MTFKLWLLSLIFSTLAPHLISRKKQKPKNSPHYQPGNYFEHTMSVHKRSEQK